MSKEPKDSTERVEVKIFNRIYVLRSKSGPERIEEVARIVDERMRQISSQITTHDIVKIAVLAALNLADEIYEMRNYREDTSVEKSEDKEQQSWFDNFFDAEVPAKDRSERLSSKVSERLRGLRPGNQEGINIEAEDE
ncbi:MAG TPA: cell division protein ZapA [Pyrinomonadaceae bacterium]|nr:cell division protein ZapA [Pyrinomonadaceae bacterium]